MTWRLSTASRQSSSHLESQSIGERQRDGGYAIPLVMGLSTWQLHRAQECRLGRRPERLENKSSAVCWLRGYRQDPFAMVAMRQALLSEGSSHMLIRMRDTDVIEQVARLLECGLWHVCEVVMQLSPIFISQQPAFAAPPAQTAPSPAPPSPRVSEVPEPATLAGNVDQAALAQTLILAASSGIPFCEECAKMAQAGGRRGAQG